MAKPLELTLGFNRTPYTEALFQGEVQPQGVHLTPTNEFSAGLDNTGERHRRILAGQLPGGECSTSSFLLARTRGVPLVAIPVFPARSFPHRQIYCHAEALVKTPADLGGKRVTVHRWNSTSPTWTKGLLENEYGVDLRSVHWFTAEPDPPGEGAPPDFRLDRIPAPASRSAGPTAGEGTAPSPLERLSSGVSPMGPRERAVEMLAAGELDGGLDPYIHPGPGIRRVLENWQDEAAGFFRRTGIYPMSHTVVLRQELVDQHPWLVEALVGAFQAARQAADRYLSADERAYEDWLREVLGADPRACGLGPVERRTLEELVRYQFQQGLRTTPIDPVACFATDG